MKTISLNVLLTDRKSHNGTKFTLITCQYQNSDEITTICLDGWPEVGDKITVTKSEWP